MTSSPDIAAVVAERRRVVSRLEAISRIPIATRTVATQTAFSGSNFSALADEFLDAALQRGLRTRAPPVLGPPPAAESPARALPVLGPSPAGTTAAAPSVLGQDVAVSGPAPATRTATHRAANGKRISRVQVIPPIPRKPTTPSVVSAPRRRPARSLPERTGPRIVQTIRVDKRTPIVEQRGDNYVVAFPLGDDQLAAQRGSESVPTEQ